MNVNNLVNVGIFFIGVGIWSLYQSEGLLMSLEQEVQYLFTLNFTLPFNWKIHLLNFAGAIMCCLKYKADLKVPKSSFESLVACTLFRFGGTTLAGKCGFFFFQLMKYFPKMIQFRVFRFWMQ